LQWVLPIIHNPMDKLKH